MEQIAEISMSGIGQVAEVMWHIRGVAQAVIAEATSVQSQVEGKMSTMEVQVEVSTSRIIGGCPNDWNRD